METPPRWQQEIIALIEENEQGDARRQRIARWRQEGMPGAVAIAPLAPPSIVRSLPLPSRGARLVRLVAFLFSGALSFKIGLTIGLLIAALLGGGR